LVVDSDGIYDLGDFNDRMLLGLKNQWSEALSGHRNKASYSDLAVNPTRTGLTASHKSSASTGSA
jgi:hypothetical protein